MKNLYKILCVTLALIISSCSSLVEDININPNKITVEDVNPELFLAGALLANSSMAVGHLNRISGMWSGQLVGYSSLYSNIYGYNISTAETDGTWRRVYIGIIPNVRHIISLAPNDNLLKGISKVTEAMGISLAASLFGDLPYSEVNGEIEDPRFEGQVSVLNAALSLLDQGIADLSSAVSRSLSEDIYFQGDADKWKAVGYTIKAKIHMMQRNYSEAYAAAQNGILDAGDNLSHNPRGDEGVTDGDKNLFFEIIAGSRAGDIGSRDSYMMSLLDASNDNYRGNSKTNEEARFGYYTIDENIAVNNQGVINQFEPQNIITFQENHLILAEAGARVNGFATGLQHLNEFRDWLNGGGGVNDNFQDLGIQYDAYEEADFASGGIENLDGIDMTKALIREIIEERYLSGFGTFMPFDDARRLRKSDNDVAVPIPLNVTSASQQPERFPYPDDELNTNSNSPGSDPGIFVKTEVNQ